MITGHLNGIVCCGIGTYSVELYIFMNILSVESFLYNTNIEYCTLQKKHAAFLDIAEFRKLFLKPQK